LEFNRASNLPRIQGGQDQLTLVFNNLIQNAKDAMRDRGSTLSIDCSRVEEGGKHWAVVKVSDTGIGIEPKNRFNIFQAGFTTKTTQNQVEIGLWWSRTYVRSLDGMLDFESVVGEGTTFRVMLPIAKED
jgi:signal transduction histidine kinase